jgi:hypothetical protein
MQRREVTVIQKALKRAESRIKLNKSWSAIHMASGIGELVGEYLMLSGRDRERLRLWVKQKVGFDPLSNDVLAATRMEVAQQGRNEKVASQTVFGSLVQVARADGKPIMLRTGQASVPPGSLLSVEPGNLVVAQETLIVVENGSVMRLWHKLELPEVLGSALLIYRGHGRDVEDVMELVREGDAACKYGFFDFDPAGMEMGLSLGLQGLLIPRSWASLTNENTWVKAFNQPDTFWRQRPSFERIQAEATNEIKHVVKHIGDHRLALMQEHLVEHRVELGLIIIE